MLCKKDLPEEVPGPAGAHQIRQRRVALEIHIMQSASEVMHSGPESRVFCHQSIEAMKCLKRVRLNRKHHEGTTWRQRANLELLEVPVYGDEISS